jgi:hypothetical protein
MGVFALSCLEPNNTLDNIQPSGLMYPSMKKLWILGFLAIVLLLTCCWWVFQSGGGPETHSYAARDVPNLPKNLPLTSVRQQGSVTIARLQREAQIDGFPCAAGWVHFAESGTFS